MVASEFKPRIHRLIIVITDNRMSSTPNHSLPTSATLHKLHQIITSDSFSLFKIFFIVLLIFITIKHEKDFLLCY